MGVLVLSSLVVKRHLEKRKRPWRVWSFDVAKQLVGQATLHACNILVSMVAGNSSSNNPCSLYFLNILIDTTIGVGIFYLGLLGYTKLFVKHMGPEGFTSGQYGRPPQWRFWLRQLQPYLAAVVTMKLIVILIVTLPGLSGALIRGTQSMLGYLSLDVQVIFVLAVFPVIMNVFQFCVMDQVIKAGKGVEHKELRDQDEEEMDGYAPVPTREHARRASGTALSRTSSRSSSTASFSVPEERGLLEGRERSNAWSALNRQRSGTEEVPHTGLARRTSHASLRGTDDNTFVDEPDAVPLSPLSPRMNRT